MGPSLFFVAVLAQQEDSPNRLHPMTESSPLAVSYLATV
jgi:hypothetical protein